MTQDVVARNTGSTLLLSVRLSSNVAGTCVREFGLLFPGQSVALSCRGPASTSRTVTGSVRALDIFGRTLTDSSSDTLQVVHPAIAVRASASPSVDVPGEHVGYPVVVTNTGDSTLSGVTVTPHGATCPAPAGTLGAGASTTVQCGTTAASAGTAQFTAAGHDQLGDEVSASASAGFTVVRPSLAMTVTAPSGPVAAGSVVPVTVQLRNTGTAAFTDLRVTGTPAACQRTIPSLAVGADYSYTCQVTVTTTTRIALTATATPAPGGVSAGSGFAVTQTGALVLQPGVTPTTPAKPNPPASPPPPTTTVVPPPGQAAAPPPSSPPTVPPRKPEIVAEKGPLKTAPVAVAAVIGVLGVLVMTVTVGAFTSAAKSR